MVTQTQIGASNRTRNLPISPELEAVLSYAEQQTGVTASVWSGGQSPNHRAGQKGDGGVGSTRHNAGNAADVDLYYNGRKLDERNLDDRALIAQFMANAAAAGATGFGGSVNGDYMGYGRFHVGFGRQETGNIFAERPGVYRGPEWLREAVTNAGPQKQAALLQSLGYEHADPTQAVRQFQRDNGLAVDGIVGPDTRRAILQSLATVRSATNTGPNRPEMPPTPGLMPGTAGPIGNAIRNVVGSVWNAFTGQPQPLPGTPAPGVPIPAARPQPPVAPLPTYEQGLAQRPGAPTRSTNITNSAGATGLPFMPLPQPRPSPPQSRAGTNVLPSGLWASGIPAAPLPTPRPAAATPAAQPSAYSMPAPRFGPGSQTGTSPMSRDVTQGVTQPRTSGFALPAPVFGAGSMTGTPINVPVAAPPPPVVSTKTIPATYKTVQSLGSAAGAAGNALLKGANAAANVFGNVFGGNPLAQAGWPSTPQRVVATPSRTVRTVTPAPLPVSTPGKAWNGQFLSAPPQGATNANAYYDATTGKWQTYRPQSQSSNSGFRSGSNWSGYSSAPPAGSSNSNTYYDRTTGTWGSY